MSRQLKKPDFDSEKIMQDYMDALVEAYGTPYDDRLLMNVGHVSLNDVTEEFGITAMKARKLLVTAGVYSTETGRRIRQLYAEGMLIADIGKSVGLSRSSVHSYLPYSKGAYNAKELSTNAERTRLYRERRDCVKELQECMGREDSLDYFEVEDKLWQVLERYQGYPFYTAKGLKFTYHIRGNEMFVSRKEKSITDQMILYIEIDIWKE